MSMNDQELDRIFATIQKQGAPVTADLRSRMLTDVHSLALNRPSPARTWVARIVDALGGWGPVAALTACLVLGIGLGAAPEGLFAAPPAPQDEPIVLSLSLGDTLFAEVTP